MALIFDNLLWIAINMNLNDVDVVQSNCQQPCVYLNNLVTTL